MPAAAPVIPASELTLESIQQSWPNILSAAKGMTASMLKNGVPAQYTGGTLTVHFKQEFNRVGCQDKHDEICKIFTAATGAPINMKFELQTGGGSDNATVNQVPTATPAGNKAISSAKRQEIMDDPDVKTIMSGLNATVLNIEPAKEE